MIDHRTKIFNSIDKRRERGEKLNVRAVARCCRLTPLRFYSRYPELRMHIMRLRMAGTRRQAAA